MTHDLLFNQESHRYAAIRPTYPIALFEFIKNQVPSLNRAWDCATGNGQAAVGLAHWFTTVNATDISENQIAHHLQKKNIHFSIQCAEKMGFADSLFDAICVAQALHWFDLESFWPEVHRLLKPNGLFITVSYAWCEVSDAVDSIVDNVWREAIHPYWAENNRLCWDRYQHVNFPFKKLDTPNITMTQQWTAMEYMNYLRTWSASRLFIEENGEALFNEVCSKILSAFGAPDTKLNVHFPLTIIAGHRWD